MAVESMQVATGHRPVAGLPDTQTMLAWIAEIEVQGIRLPGYPANYWIQDWAEERYRELGLQKIRRDPIEVTYWKPEHWSLTVWQTGSRDESIEIPCWPVPLSANAEALEGELVLTPDGLGSQQGRIAVTELALMNLQCAQVRDETATWSYDPENDFDALNQILPVGPRWQNVMEPHIEAGAIGFIGILDFPWQTHHYGVPYDALARPIPGLYLSRENGTRLKALMAQGLVRGRIELQREQRPAPSCNVIGELPGNSDEWIIIGSHHDGPWHSAVEDASGVALVLAQAHYWSQLPQQERPHNLLFLLNGGHMSGAAGLLHFVATHRAFIQEKVVLEIHLEHAAREAKVEMGRLLPTDKPEVRWWFTSRIPRLEESVARAICKQRLGRSMILPPEGFPLKDAEHPPSDAALFHPLTPIVSFITGPMYLFDPLDRLNMVHEDSLVPLTRAVIGIINELQGLSAAAMRRERYSPPRKTPLPTIAALLSSE